MVVAEITIQETPLVAKVVKAGRDWAAFVELPDGSSFGKVRIVKNKGEAIAKARADLSSLSDLIEDGA